MNNETNYSSTVGNITTVSAVSREQIVNNLKYSASLKYKNICDTKFYSVNKENSPIALVGGGPSLKSNLDELRNFNGFIWACGSVHDYLLKNNIAPHACVVCDPDPIAANYLNKASGSIIYYIASQCDPAVFNKLKANAVVLWHCYNNNREDIEANFPGFKAFGGGCTVGLRALTLAFAMNFTNIHLFGFDSCLSEDGEHHSYGFNSGEELGEIFEVLLDKVGGKIYKTLGYQLAQVQHFNEFYRNYGDKFNPVFHGTGLLPDLFDRIKAEAQNMMKETTDG